mmetsp:Transcript_11708/g.35675  ORF Transcript_11708/g.35675 Transcript_11708/m.35675 type:complete len:322 (+) Transcript_11708:358-1323(+)
MTQHLQELVVSLHGLVDAPSALRREGCLRFVADDIVRHACPVVLVAGTIILGAAPKKHEQRRVSVYLNFAFVLVTPKTAKLLLKEPLVLPRLLLHENLLHSAGIYTMGGIEAVAVCHVGRTVLLEETLFSLWRSSKPPPPEPGAVLLALFQHDLVENLHGFQCRAHLGIHAIAPHRAEVIDICQYARSIAQAAAHLQLQLPFPHKHHGWREQLPAQHLPAHAVPSADDTLLVCKKRPGGLKMNILGGLLLYGCLCSIVCVSSAQSLQTSIKPRERPLIRSFLPPNHSLRSLRASAQNSRAKVQRISAPSPPPSCTHGFLPP